MSPAKAANSARTAKPPPPVWIGMPSAWETSTPSAFARKQEKSCAWEKIGLRAVRVMTQPICRLIWSSRFWVRARVTGSSTVIGPSPTGSSYRLRRGQVNDVVAGGIVLDRIVGADQQGCSLFLDAQGPVKAVARREVAAAICSADN